MTPWREIQKKNFIHWQKLAKFLELSETEQLEILQKPSFPLNLPLRLAEKIEKKTLHDPILKQFLPTLRELDPSPQTYLDPVGDCLSQKKPKLLHKYQGRALLLLTSACAMNCRFCFRQNFSYETEYKGFKEEIEYLSQDPSIVEVILSGGDPLSLSNETLLSLWDELHQIPHIQRVRFHTRFPIGIPERIDADFLSLLEHSRLQIFFTLHANHPKEFDPFILSQLKKVHKTGTTLLLQTVLLQGVNDNLETLHSLFSLATNHGILPYYLHQLDRVKGSLHFEVAEETGKHLIESLSSTLSGYAIPRYVREIAGKPSKTPL